MRVALRWLCVMLVAALGGAAPRLAHSQVPPDSVVRDSLVRDSAARDARIPLLPPAADTLRARRRAPVLRAPLSPRRAFLMSLLVPGLAQARLDRATSGALFAAVEMGAFAMLRRSQADVAEVRRQGADTIPGSFTVNPATGAITPGTAVASRFDDTLERTQAPARGGLDRGPRLQPSHLRLRRVRVRTALGRAHARVRGAGARRVDVHGVPGLVSAMSPEPQRERSGGVNAGGMNPLADARAYDARVSGITVDGSLPAPIGTPAGDRLDAALLARMARQDSEALGVLYDRWVATVRGLVQRIVHEASDTDEVVEEVFWQSWQQASRFEAERGRVAVWLLTIARSRALDRLRARKRHRVVVPDTFEDGTSRLEQLAAPDAARDPGELADQRDRVSSALAELPDEQREVVRLAYFSGLSQSEIAEHLALPLGTVKTRTRLAFGKLRDSLATLWDGES